MEGFQRQLNSIPVKQLYIIGGITVLAVAGIVKLIQSSKSKASKAIPTETRVTTRIGEEKCSVECKCNRSKEDNRLHNPYKIHLFVCVFSNEWPILQSPYSNDQSFINHLSDAIKLNNNIKVSFCYEESTGYANDILVFPHQLRYKNLTIADLPKFLNDLQTGQSINHLDVEPINSPYVFVCSHKNQCGICESVQVSDFTLELANRGITTEILVRKTNLGGCGSVFCFGFGDCFEYVKPQHVGLILDYVAACETFSKLTSIEYIGMGIGSRKVLKEMWRGRMGMSVEEQKEACDNWRIKINDVQ